MNPLTPPERDIGLMFHLDTNRINAFGGLKNICALEEWDADEVILLELSESTQREALAGGNKRRRKKVNRHIVALDEVTNRDEVRRVREIEAILFPAGVKSENERNDVLVVFNAGKYGAILVTNDGGSRRQPGGILGNRDALRALGINVMTDEEAVQLVKRRIEIRDQSARRWAQVTGKPEPDWIGED